MDMLHHMRITFQHTIFQLYIYESLSVTSMSVQIWSFSGPYFSAFDLNTVIYSVNLHIHFEWGEMMSDAEEYVIWCVT